ncbi:MAG: tetratricopeptide (TPR) repeat protein [Rhodoferax sp.]|jgi:tetratricopeptide (TPR) repeat protein
MDYYGLMTRLNRFPFLLAFVCALTANAQTPDKAPAPPITSAMDGELFYQLLLGELNARGGEPSAGFSLILDAARKTNNAVLFQRAVDIALQARSGDSALLAARAWRQTLPTSREANRYILQILIGLNRIAETREPLKREVAGTALISRSAAIASIPRYFTRATNKTLAASVVEQALADYVAVPVFGIAAWTTIGRMRFEAGDIPGALDAASRSQAMDATAEGPALLSLAMMGAQVPQAETLVKKYLEGRAATTIRMEYIRVLLDTQRYADANQELQQINTEKPDFPDAWLIRGALELQNRNYPAAESALQRYVVVVMAKRTGTTLVPTDQGLVQAYLSLAEIAEQRNDLSQAEAWLQRINSAGDLLMAQLRRATLLAKQGRLEEARQLIRSQPDRAPADARLKLNAEVQLLRDSQQFTTALGLLQKASAQDPKDWDLVYDMAMIAEQMDNLVEMERLLRNVMAGKPDNPHAYNALGYSLADRNVRLPEAKQLVLKALEFTPDDPFINDSLGWVEFRSGNLAEAQRILQVAYAAKPDAEIAAHLGEVLWALGQRDQAIDIWKEGAKINAENGTLLETLKRLRVTF